MHDPAARDAPLGTPAQIVLGLAVIVTGLFFLLANLGLIDVDFTVHLWPSLLIVFGILKIMQTRSTRGYLVGAGLMLTGGVLLLNAMGVFHFEWHTLWPILLILLGVSVIFRSPGGRRMRRRASRGESAAGGVPTLPYAFDKPRATRDGEEGVVDITSVLGGHSSRLDVPFFRGGDITAIMGGCELDLRRCSIEGEAVLNVFSLCGGISLKVPPDWSVVLQGVPILGGFEAKTIAPPDGAKRLLVRGYSILGGLEVRN